MSTDTSQSHSDGVDKTDAPDDTESNEPTGPDAGAEDDGDDQNGDDEDQDDSDGPGREAARYRRRLRDAETQRDQLAQRVESLQRAEVERQASADGLRPAALWASGVELADLLDDDGTVSVSRVSEAVGVAREQLGIPKPPAGNYVKSEGRNIGRAGRPSGREAMASVVMGRSVGDDG